MKTVSEFEKKPFNPEAAVKEFFGKGFSVDIVKLGNFVNIFLRWKTSIPHRLKADWNCPKEIFNDPVKLKEGLEDFAIEINIDSRGTIPN